MTFQRLQCKAVLLIFQRRHRLFSFPSRFEIISSAFELAQSSMTRRGIDEHVEDRELIFYQSWKESNIE